MRKDEWPFQKQEWCHPIMGTSQQSGAERTPSRKPGIAPRITARKGSSGSDSGSVPRPHCSWRTSACAATASMRSAPEASGVSATAASAAAGNVDLANPNPHSTSLALNEHPLFSTRSCPIRRRHEPRMPDDHAFCIAVLTTIDCTRLRDRGPSAVPFVDAYFQTGGARRDRFRHAFKISGSRGRAT